LRAMRNLVGAGGTVLIGDVAGGEAYTAPAELDERLDYAYSLVHCLPLGMYGPNAVGTGTLMRPATLWSYAQTAGFANMSVLPIEHPSWRFYRLTGWAEQRKPVIRPFLNMPPTDDDWYRS